MVDNQLEMCPLCFNLENVKRNAGFVECPFCGSFICDAAANDLLTNCPDEFDDNQRLKVRYVVKKRHLQNIANNQRLGFEHLTETRIKEIDNTYHIPQLMDKSLLVLEYLLEQTTYFQEYVTLHLPKIFQLFYCKHTTELFNIIQFLYNNEYIEILNKNMLSKFYGSCNYGSDYYKYNFAIEIIPPEHEAKNYIHYGVPKVFITNKGIEYCESKKRLFNASKQAFVAMWFNKDENIEKCNYNMQKVYENAIEPAISTSKDKYNAMRIDCKEHCNDINDEMIAEIRKSKFVVADLTGYRGGVYFEAGFAYGLGLPVIYTCNQEWLNTQKDDKGNIIREGVHFDLNHRNMILWDYNKLEDFKEALRKRIEAIII